MKHRLQTLDGQRLNRESCAMLTIAEIERALRLHPHEPAKFTANASHAAVAMILGDGSTGLEVCFIRRAERDGDPWSGQVAFPGGRASPGDQHAHDVAERETREEIGLHLTPAQRVGPLPVRPIQPNSARSGMTLSPFVYYVAGFGHGVAGPRLPDEVASVFWVPIEHLFDAEAVTELAYPPGHHGSVFPGIRYEEHVIWGLTLRVLASFAEVMRRELPAYT